ncbi:MAG: DUF2283 domain-containing protein [Dehalococcoidia bacterium]|nr:DUF2283 domain-containing protein [Dehalococcoidia bacterium]
MSPYITYDEQSDVLYVEFRQAVGDTASHDAGGNRFVETDSDGVVSIEFLTASAGVDLAGLPHADEIAQALDRLRALLAGQAATA